MLIHVTIIRLDDEDQTDTDIEVLVEVDYNSDDGVTSCEFRAVCAWDKDIAFTLTEAERARIMDMREDDDGSSLDQLAAEEDDDARTDAQVADIEMERGY